MSGYEIPFSAEARGGVTGDSGDAAGVLLPVQTHSCNVAVITADTAIPALEDTDAVISLRPGLRIGVRTADCVPILLWAPDIKAVAAIHAGWKGSIGGIAGATVARLRSLGADPELIEAAFGPCICGECYEVSPAMVSEFSAAGYSHCIIGERHIDLEAVNRSILLREGLQTQNIRSKRYCTFQTASAAVVAPRGHRPAPGVMD